MPLTGKQTQFLRALAHPLKPLVQVGSKGVSDTLILQITEQLGAHELIKVRFNTDSIDPAEVIDEVIERTKSELVQKLGRTLILYKRHELSPKLELPGTKKKREITIAVKTPTRAARKRSKALASRREKRTDEASGRAAQRASKASAQSSAPARRKRPERSVPGAKPTRQAKRARPAAPAATRTRPRPRPEEEEDES